MKKSILILFVLCLACFMMTSFVFGQAMPSPGTVIDKSNYKQYAHLFPPEYAQGFENGWGGFFKPITVKVVAPKPSTQPKALLTLSEKNRGKYSIDKDGFMTGGYDYIGLPFPDLKPDDKDFATKYMYNYTYSYRYDDPVGPAFNCEKRRGGKLTNTRFNNSLFYFFNRQVMSPKPLYTPNPEGLRYAQTIDYTYPNSQIGMKMLKYSYLGQRKADDIYIYLPTLRRVLRGDASSRSTPIQGTTQSWDDFGGFEGNVQEFTYRLLGEKKILAITRTTATQARWEQMQAEDNNLLPWWSDDYELRDVYVIELKAKDSKYPQSIKVVYADKDNLAIYYAVAWDRAGQLWKIFENGNKSYTLPNGDEAQTQQTMPLGLDVQVGFATSFITQLKPNNNGKTLIDFVPTALVAKGR